MYLVPFVWPVTCSQAADGVRTVIDLVGERSPAARGILEILYGCPSFIDEVTHMLLLHPGSLVPEGRKIILVRR
jgi:hypothetical protein